MLLKFYNKTKGYKTYIALILLAVYAVLGLVLGELEAGKAGELIALALVGVGFRDALN